MGLRNWDDTVMLLGCISYINYILKLQSSSKCLVVENS